MLVSNTSNLGTSYSVFPNQERKSTSSTYNTSSKSTYNNYDNAESMCSRISSKEIKAGFSMHNSQEDYQGGKKPKDKKKDYSKERKQKRGE